MVDNPMHGQFFCKLRLISTFAVILLETGGAIGQMKMPMCHPTDSGDPVPPEQLPAAQVIAGAGNVRFPITANAKAQMWFEQGINLLYDFWDYEAARAFEESIRADANCAMCYWGLYHAETFNHSETKSYAQDSLKKAVALKAPRELAGEALHPGRRSERLLFARPAPRTKRSPIGNRAPAHPGAKESEGYQCPHRTRRGGQRRL